MSKKEDRIVQIIPALPGWTARIGSEAWPVVAWALMGDGMMDGIVVAETGEIMSAEGFQNFDGYNWPKGMP